LGDAIVVLFFRFVILEDGGEGRKLCAFSLWNGRWKSFGVTHQCGGNEDEIVDKGWAKFHLNPAIWGAIAGYRVAKVQIEEKFSRSRDGLGRRDGDGEVWSKPAPSKS
jgi:hypothetical protein